MGLLRINASNIHDKIIHSTKELRSMCTLPDAFVLNNLEVDYMLHKTNVAAETSDLLKFKLNWCVMQRN